MRSTLVLLFCLAPLLAAQAQTSPSPPPAPAVGSPPTLTVDEAVALAVANNPRLSAANREVLAARQGVRSARARVNPEFTVTPSLGGGSDQAVLLQQSLELNGTRPARTGVAAAALRQREAEAVVALRALVYDTKTAYYELARTQAARVLASDLLDAAEEFDRITRRQVETGARPGIEQTQTGIEAARARQQRTLAESETTRAEAALNTLMGRDPTTPIAPLPPLAPAPPAPAPDLQTLMRQALAARAEIQAETAVRQGFEQEARLARAEGRPDLAPQFRVGSFNGGEGGGSGVGIGVRLPLFDYGSRRARVRQAEEQARAQTERVRGAENTVRQEVAQALARLRAADTVAQNYETGILDQARRLRDASQTGFQAGATSVLAVLEAQRTYRTVQSEYINALAAQAQARAELERALGALPATAEQTPVPSPAPQRRGN